MTLDELIVSARECGFRDLESIKKLAREAVALHPRDFNGHEPPGSRFGGLPTMTGSVPWPQRNGRSLSFIAQIELTALPRVAVEQGFPGEGLLLFFYDAEQSTWGFDPKDAGSFAVIHVPESDGASAITDWPKDFA